MEVLPSHRRLACVAALLMATLGPAACGSGDHEGLPANVEARVGQVNITTAQVIDEVQAEKVRLGRDQHYYELPDHVGCVGHKKALALPGKVPSKKQRLAQCQREFEGWEAAALGRLIRYEWARRELQRRGVTAKVPEDREETLLETIKAPAKDIVRYYRRHRNEYGPPRRRDAWILRVPTKAEAAAAKEGLKNGKGWTPTADEATDNHTSKRAYGEPRTLLPGEFPDPEFEKFLYTAPIGVITDPVHTRKGWYITQVIRESPPPAEPPARDRSDIAIKVRLAAMRHLLRARYMPETTCASDFAAHRDLLECQH